MNQVNETSPIPPQEEGMKTPYLDFLVVTHSEFTGTFLSNVYFHFQ